MTSSATKNRSSIGQEDSRRTDRTCLFCFSVAAALLSSGFADSASCLAQSDQPAPPTRRTHGLPNHPLEPEVSPYFPKAPAPVLPDKRKLSATGTVHKAVLLIRFSNHRNRQLPPPSAYDTVLNTSGKNYAREVSYGKLDLVSQVTPWIDLPQSEQYYASRRSGGRGSRLAEALTYASDFADRHGLIDFSEFDRNSDRYVDVLTFIHSGYGAEVPAQDPNGFGELDRIWSHQDAVVPSFTLPKSRIRVSDYAISAGLHGASGQVPTRLGLMAHEAGHQGGLPDLYDTSGLPVNQRGEGIGAWGVMGVGWGFDGSGKSPAHPSAFSKVASGWMTAETLTESGTYELRQSIDSPTCFRIDAGFPEGEYILIENRQPKGFDGQLPGRIGGLAIWHVDLNKIDTDTQAYNYEPGYPDQAGWPENGRHYAVALLQADGRYDLEQGLNTGDVNDLFRDGRVDNIGPDTTPPLRPYGMPRDQLKVINRISGISASGEVMTFRYDVERRSPILVASADSSDSSENRLAPIRGARAEASEFSADASRLLRGDAVLLEKTITLDRASHVHISGDTSVTSQTKGCTFATAVTGNSATFQNAIKDSIRLVSVPAIGGYTTFTVNARVRLSAGRHVIRWMIRSPNAQLKFGAGGSLTVRMFPAGGG